MKSSSVGKPTKPGMSAPENGIPEMPSERIWFRLF